MSGVEWTHHVPQRNMHVSALHIEHAFARIVLTLNLTPLPPLLIYLLYPLHREETQIGKFSKHQVEGTTHWVTHMILTCYW